GVVAALVIDRDVRGLTVPIDDRHVVVVAVVDRGVGAATQGVVVGAPVVGDRIVAVPALLVCVLAVLVIDRDVRGLTVPVDDRHVVVVAVVDRGVGAATQ